MRILVVLIFAAILTILPILTIPSARAVTTNEMTTFFECSSVLQVSSHERYSCDRVGLYLAGECEGGLPNPSLCEMVTQYIQDNRLQNEQRLTQAEVVEDLRVISMPETEDEKTFTEGLFDDYPGLQNGE